MSAAPIRRRVVRGRCPPGTYLLTYTDAYYTVRRNRSKQTTHAVDLLRTCLAMRLLLLSQNWNKQWQPQTVNDHSDNMRDRKTYVRFIYSVHKIKYVTCVINARIPYCTCIRSCVSKIWGGGHCLHQLLHHRVNFLCSPKPKKYELHIGYIWNLSLVGLPTL